MFVHFVVKRKNVLRSLEQFIIALHFFYQNKLFKNNEDKIDKQIRTNSNHFEAGKFNNKKQTKKPNYLNLF